MPLDLMSRVVPEQRWGVADSLPSNAPDGTGVALKNGWYPTYSISTIESSASTLHHLLLKIPDGTA